MSKTVNAVFGIAIGVLVFITLVSGINVFLNEPQYEDYCEERFVAEPLFDCADNMTVGECRAQGYEKQAYDNACYDELSAAQDVYHTKYFIAAAILGLVTLLVSMMFLNKMNIAAGLIMAGVVLIFWSYMVGWSVTNEVVRFISALVNAAVVIYLALRVQARSVSKKKK